MGTLGKIFLASLVLLIFFTGCAQQPAEKPAAAPAAPLPKPTVYEGTVYVSGMGGHFSEAKIKIDPSNSAEPIEMVSLDRIKLHTDINISKKIYATHDPRIDLKTNTLYWSAYVNDSGDVHVGKVNLGTSKVEADVKISRDASYKSGPMYCGSGQSTNEYLPVFMGYPGYIDIVDKATMAHKKRVYLDSPEIPKSYTWAHGVNSPDGKYMMLWLGESPEGKAGVFPRENPNTHVFKLDMAALLNGELKILRKGTVVGDPKTTAAFRGFFTNDGKYLLLSGRDRGYVIDAETLRVVDAEILPAGWENHDIMPTHDDKYALFTLRVPVAEVDGKKIMDGQLQLYDMAKKELFGKPVSVCDSCHVKEDVTGSAILCGQDAVWQVDGKITSSSAGLSLK